MDTTEFDIAVGPPDPRGRIGVTWITIGGKPIIMKLVILRGKSVFEQNFGRLSDLKDLGLDP